MGKFEYERLAVSDLALELNEGVWRLLQRHRRSGSLEKQIERAVESIALNIAEGAGEFSPQEKARFYRIAKRSADEAAMGLAIFVRRHPRYQSECSTLHAQLNQVAAMLVAMIKTKSRLPAGPTS